MNKNFSGGDCLLAFNPTKELSWPRGIILHEQRAKEDAMSYRMLLACHGWHGAKPERPVCAVVSVGKLHPAAVSIGQQILQNDFFVVHFKCYSRTVGLP